MITSIQKRLRSQVKSFLWARKQRLHVPPDEQTEIVNTFHKLYYNTWMLGGPTMPVFWLGVEMLKCPLDLWTYQEIIFERKPDLIIETGTHRGGSALFMASLLDLIGKGRVVTIDIEQNKAFPIHPRIQYIHGSSVSKSVIEELEKLASNAQETMVILDSDHSEKHVRHELELYNKFVSVGSYLIVEDTNLNGHPVTSTFGPGPSEAVRDFLSQHKHFIVDKQRERFFMTFNPSGYLKRKK